jgi:hypothetical protein
VEAVRFAPGKKWKKKLVGKAVGADYAVDPAEVAASAVEVIDGGRTAFADPVDGSVLDRIYGGLSSLPAAHTEEIPAGVLAVALPLWFRETVPYRRAYRAT